MAPQWHNSTEADRPAADPAFPQRRWLLHRVHRGWSSDLTRTATRLIGRQLLDVLPDGVG